MVVISKTQLNQFGKSHADAGSALDDWYKIVKQADWGSFTDKGLSYKNAFNVFVAFVIAVGDLRRHTWRPS